jgi:hypothetical protein
MRVVFDAGEWGNYVEVEALARVANGALSFNGNQITLTLPVSGNAAAATVRAAVASQRQMILGDFCAGIEAEARFAVALAMRLRISRSR